MRGGWPVIYIFFEARKATQDFPDQPAVNPKPKKQTNNTQGKTKTKRPRDGQSKKHHGLFCFFCHGVVFFGFSLCVFVFFGFFGYGLTARAGHQKAPRKHQETQGSPTRARRPRRAQEPPGGPAVNPKPKKPKNTKQTHGKQKEKKTP